MTSVSARRRGVRNRLRDLRGAARLGVAATLAVTDIVESMHANIARVPAPLGPAIADRTGGITGLVYRRHSAARRSASVTTPGGMCRATDAIWPTTWRSWWATGRCRCAG